MLFSINASYHFSTVSDFPKNPHSQRTFSSRSDHVYDKVNK